MPEHKDPRWQEEPAVGHRQKDASGRVWVKTRKLGHDRWGAALVDAVSYTRVGQPVPEAVVAAMGYDLEGPC